MTRAREARGAVRPRREAARPAPAPADDRRANAFHWIVLAGAAATILLTWPLWQTREAPPMIPLLPLPSVGTAVPILASLALAAAFPALGLGAYALVLTYAVAADATRLQPALVSFGLLMTARLPGRAGPAIARAHLLSLWFYAGLHKLLSPEFMADRRNPWMLEALVGDAPGWLRQIYPEIVIAGEIGLALAATIPATRRLAALWAFLLHASILLPLSPLGRDWNRSVWAWNALLAVSGFFLVAPWRESIRESWRAAPSWAKAVVALIAIFPAASQIGYGDPYLAHHLYSQSTPISYVCRTDQPPPERPGLGRIYPTPDGKYQCRFIDFFPWLKVPEPGEHWFAHGYFNRTCAPGDILFIRERRRFFLARQQQWNYFLCRRGPT
jgi:hypothetical protein